MLTAALGYAARGAAVLPLAGKAPVLKGGRGVLDATCDPAQITAWWTRRPRANVGIRVPEHLVVIDVDPQHGGHFEWAARVGEAGLKLSDIVTLTCWSGRGNRSRHLYFNHPGGKVTGCRLGRGIDLKTTSGYVVVPPSTHPDTGQPYRWERHPIADPPGWLIELLRPTPPKPRPQPTPRPFGIAGKESPATAFSRTASWVDILMPHGWALVAGDGDSDGSKWRHPQATHDFSATTRNGLLFCYSPNAGLPVTEPGNPRGVTRFSAYAELEHGGDMRAAARHLRRSQPSTERPRGRSVHGGAA
jgi:hypothetical protein